MCGFFTDKGELFDLAVWGIGVFTLAVIPLSFQYVFVDGLTALGRTKTALTPVPVPKDQLYASYDFAPSPFYGKGCILCGADRGHIKRNGIHGYFLLVIGNHLRKREQMETV